MDTINIKFDKDITPILDFVESVRNGYYGDSCFDFNYERIEDLRDNPLDENNYYGISC